MKKHCISSMRFVRATRTPERTTSKRHPHTMHFSTPIGHLAFKNKQHVVEISFFWPFFSTLWGPGHAWSFWSPLMPFGQIKHTNCETRNLEWHEIVFESQLRAETIHLMDKFTEYKVQKHSFVDTSWTPRKYVCVPSLKNWTQRSWCMADGIPRRGSKWPILGPFICTLKTTSSNAIILDSGRVKVGNYFPTW
jgi:hypothetical protein